MPCRMITHRRDRCGTRPSVGACETNVTPLKLAVARVVPLVRYPYKMFYRVTPDAVEILYIHHAAPPRTVGRRSLVDKI